MPRGSPPRRERIGSPQPGDEQESAWPRERLEAMDARFVAQLERAIDAARSTGQRLDGGYVTCQRKAWL